MNRNQFYPSVRIKNPQSYLLALGISLGLSTHLEKPASAAGIVGTGTLASCTDAALKARLVGGGTVTFNCGTNPVTISVTESIITANTVIDGGTKVTLSGGGQNRVFSTKDGNIQFTVKNLTIADGFTTDEGGGIKLGWRGKLNVTNCKFNNNVSTFIHPFGGGGAIYIKSESTAVINNSIFTNNKASNGGAINNLLSNLTVTNSTFTGNQSTVSGSGGGGGAIYHDGANGDNGKIIITGNTFTNNTAVLQGGAIFGQLYNRNTSTIDKSTFSGNTVTGTGNQGYGGAVFNVGGTLSGLTGFTGGSNSTIFTVTNSTFTVNTASNQGGGLWHGNNATLNITNSTFSGNKAVSPDGTGGLGGAMMRTSGKINITNVTIANNYAGFQGGAIFGASPDITLKNSIISNNKANNGGNNWNVKNNCGSYPSVFMTNGGNNIEFPQRNLNDSSDINCVSGITVADPKLGALANNGGTTQTMMLLTGSPAVNTANNNTCPTTDQRGVARPKGGICDVGAVEAR